MEDNKTIVEYYVNQFEKYTIERFTSDTFSGNHAGIIMSLFKLYLTLDQVSPNFRLHNNNNNNSRCSLPSKLESFFSNHFYKSQTDFKYSLPCLYQMIRAIQGENTARK